MLRVGPVRAADQGGPHKGQQQSRAKTAQEAQAVDLLFLLQQQTVHSRGRGFHHNAPVLSRQQAVHSVDHPPQHAGSPLQRG